MKGGGGVKSSRPSGPGICVQAKECYTDHVLSLDLYDISNEAWPGRYYSCL